MRRRGPKATDDQGNVEKLRQAYLEWDRSKGENADCWLPLLDDKVTLRSLADGRQGVEFTRRRSSKVDVASYLAGLTATMQMLYFKIDEFVAERDRVVAIGSTSWRHRATGKVFDTPKVDIWRFKNGKAVEFFEFYDTAAVQAVTS